LRAVLEAVNFLVENISAIRVNFELEIFPVFEDLVVGVEVETQRWEVVDVDLILGDLSEVGFFLH
jgi:hypothetical protein